MLAHCTVFRTAYVQFVSRPVQDWIGRQNVQRIPNQDRQPWPGWQRGGEFGQKFLLMSDGSVCQQGWGPSCYHYLWDLHSSTWTYSNIFTWDPLPHVDPGPFFRHNTDMFTWDPHHMDLFKPIIYLQVGGWSSTEKLSYVHFHWEKSNTKVMSLANGFLENPIRYSHPVPTTIKEQCRFVFENS